MPLSNFEFFNSKDFNKSLFCGMIYKEFFPEDFQMNYLYLILGFALGLVYIGRGKNARKQKFVPYEVKLVEIRGDFANIN